MPEYRVTLVSYRDCTVRAKNKREAVSWAKSHAGNSVFSEAGPWTLYSVDVEDEEDAEPYFEVFPDGMHTRIEETET